MVSFTVFSKCCIFFYFSFSLNFWSILIKDWNNACQVLLAFCSFLALESCDWSSSCQLGSTLLYFIAELLVVFRINPFCFCKHSKSFISCISRGWCMILDNTYNMFPCLRNMLSAPVSVIIIKICNSISCWCAILLFYNLNFMAIAGIINIEELMEDYAHAFRKVRTILWQIFSAFYCYSLLK